MKTRCLSLICSSETSWHHACNIHLQASKYSLWRGNEMKKIFAVMMAVAFAFSVAGFAVAAEKAAAPAAEKSATSAEKSAVSAEKSAASAEKSAASAEKSAKKAKSKEVTGTIEALDAAAGTLTVKGKKGNVDLKAGEKVKLGDFKAGDKVTVKYADGTASSVKAAKSKKTTTKTETKTETKTTTKTETVPAPAAAPAAAPAPAPVKK